eukprot:1160104-Pelagomonas_calceolata.AAC.3
MGHVNCIQHPADCEVPCLRHEDVGQQQLTFTWPSTVSAMAPPYSHPSPCLGRGKRKEKKNYISRGKWALAKEAMSPPWLSIWVQILG